MPIYTVLGGTGSTGSAVIRALLAEPPKNLTLRIFVRSKSKLLTMIPRLEAPRDDITTEIIEGKLTDSLLLSRSLQESTAIFSCIATMSPEPGTRVAEDTTAAIISALQHTRAQSTISNPYRKPVVLMISSASLNDSLNGHPPKLIFAILKRAIYPIYEDLRVATRLYEEYYAEDPELLDYILVQPPAVMPGEIPTGHRLSTTEVGVSVSFADLGVGMVAMVDRRDELKGQGVTVIATGKTKQDWRPQFKGVTTGLMAYYVPWLWELGKYWSLW